MSQILKKRFFLVFILLLFGSNISVLHGQELRCNVSVNYTLLQGNDFTFLRDLEKTIQQYISDRIWTEDRFEKAEQIDCSFGLNFTKALDLTRFEVAIDLTAMRPVYNSGQTTTTLKIVDNSWAFSYVPNQSIIHDPNRFDPLASLIDFYVYLILGYDYDSFSEMGGTAYFEKARRIVELAQTQGGSGWQYSATDRTRGSLIQEILEPRMRVLREANYDYHYNALDHFLENPNQARQAVLDMLQKLEQLSQEGSRKNTLDMFFNTKSQELVSLFENSPFAQRAYSLLIRIDAGRQNYYDRLATSN